MADENKEVAEEPTEEVLDGPTHEEGSVEALLEEATEADKDEDFADDDHQEEATVDDVADVLNDAIKNDDEEGEEGETEAEGEEGEEGEEVVLSTEDYNKLLALANGEDVEGFAGAQAEAQAQQEAAPEPEPEPEPEQTQPLAPITPFKMPETDDEMLDVLGTPESYSQHIQQVIQHTQAQTMAAMEPIIVERAMHAIAATKFQDKFFDEHPDLISHPQLVGRALQAAQNKLGADASFDDLYTETEKNVSFAKGVAKSIKKSKGRVKDVRGQIKPKGTRKAKSNAPAKKRSATEEAFAEMTNPMYDADTTQFLRDIGTAI